MTTLLASAACWQLGALHYDASQRRLTGAGQQLDLEPRQHQLLLCLLAAPGQVVSRDMLVARVWQGRVVSDSAINRAVSMLRKAFASLDNAADYVETVPKLGYRFIAAVSPAEPLKPDTMPPDTLLHDRAVKSGFSRYRAFLWLFVLLAAVVCGFIWYGSDANDANPLSAGYVVPHTGFDGLETMVSADAAGTRLLYLRQAENGVQQVWLNDLADNSHKALTPDSEDSRSAAISPDGSQFVYARFADASCQLVLRNLHSGLSKLLQPCPADNLPLFSWQPDGKTLYFRQRTDKSHPYQWYQLDIASAVSRQLTLLPADYTGLGDIALAASADSLALLRYISSDESELQLLATDSGAVMHQQRLPFRASVISWYGQSLLIAAGNRLYQYHLPGAQLSQLYQAAEPLTSFVRVQQQLYFSSSGVTAGIWQSDAGGNLSRRVASSRLDLMPRLSHHSAQLAFLSTRLGHHQLWLQQADGTERMLTELPGQPGFVRLEWSADDSQLLFAKDDAAYSVSVATGKLHELLPKEYKIGVVNAGADSNQLIYSRWQDTDWQLWLYDISRDSHRQLTSQGGYSGRISQGRLYFSKYHHNGLWVKALDSDEEQQLLSDFDKINWLNWHIAGDQLYYYQPETGIYRFDLHQQQARLHLPEPSRFVRHFQVSSQGTLFVRHGSLQGDIYRLPLSPAQLAVP